MEGMAEEHRKTMEGMLLSALIAKHDDSALGYLFKSIEGIRTHDTAEGIIEDVKAALPDVVVIQANSHPPDELSALENQLTSHSPSCFSEPLILLWKDDGFFTSQGRRIYVDKESSSGFLASLAAAVDDYRYGAVEMIRPLNIQVALEYVLHSHEMLETLANKYLNLTADRLATMRKDASLGNWEAVKVNAHLIKGGSYYVGAIRMMSLANELQYEVSHYRAVRLLRWMELEHTHLSERYKKHFEVQQAVNQKHDGGKEQ